MTGTMKRLLAGSLFAFVIALGGLAGGGDVSAYTKTHRSDDGKLVLVCHYDDRTHELAFCDVHWFPVQAHTPIVAR